MTHPVSWSLGPFSLGLFGGPTNQEKAEYWLDTGLVLA